MARKKSKKIPHLKKHHIVFSIFATVGVVAVWRGIWVVFDSLPFFEKPIVAGGLAVIILVIGGFYFKKINFW